MPTRAVVPSACFLAVMALACGSETGDPQDPADATGNPAELPACADYAAAYQALRARCPDAPSSDAENSGFVTSCSFEANLPDSGLPTWLATCKGKLATLDCAAAASETTCADLESNERGARPGAEPCESEWQCESGACSGKLGLSCGVCARVAEAGEPCEGAVVCERGSSCIGEPRACAADPRLGEPCRSGNLCGSSPSCSYRACAPGLRCSAARCTDALPAVGEACDENCAGQAICEDGTCRALPKAGEPCPNQYCADVLRCNPNTERCEREQVVGVGESCDTVRRCGANAHCLDGRCTADAGEGDACDDESDEGPYCNEESVCVSGRCETRKAACAN